MIAFVVVSLPLAWIRYELSQRAGQQASLRALQRRGVHVIVNGYINPHPIYRHFEQNFSMEQVSQVWAYDCRLNDADLRLFAGLDNLETVRLVNTDITDVGLLQLAAFPSLKRVSVTSSIITKNGVHQFKQARPDVQLFLLKPSTNPNWP